MERNDAELLQHTIGLALANVASGGGPFGALVARDGVTVATGVNRVVASGDPTAHAEIIAIRAACEAVASFSLAGATLYASCEPCPMCLAAAWWARIARIVFAATRAEAAAAGFEDQRFYAALAGHTQAGLPRPIRLDAPGWERPFQAWAARPDWTAY